MELIPLKTCKICQIEKPKIKFSGRSARCCACMYAKNKDFFAKYYTDNGDTMKTYEKVKYHIKYDDVPKMKRGRKKKEAIIMPIFDVI